MIPKNQETIVEDAPKPRVPQSDEKLKKLAMDMYDNKIFTSDMVKKPNDMPMVFMPLVFGALANLCDAERKEIGLIYEYYDQAGPRGINGMPSFFSMRVLYKDELARLQVFFDAYKKMKDEFAGPKEEKTDDINAV